MAQCCTDGCRSVRQVHAINPTPSEAQWGVRVVVMGQMGRPRLFDSESRPLAARETVAVVERDRPGPRQVRGVDSWRAVIERRGCSSRSHRVALDSDAGRTRNDFAWPRSLSDIDRSTAANDLRPSASCSARKNPQRIPVNTPPVFPGLRPCIWPHLFRLVTNAMSDRLLAMARSIRQIPATLGCVPSKSAASTMPTSQSH